MTVRAPRSSHDPDARNDPAVEDAFRAAPATMRAEIVDGELHTQPRPGIAHANSASVLGGELHGPFRRGKGGPGGWLILFDPELHLGAGPDKLVPDLAGWRRERLPDAGSAEPSAAHFEIAPDWVAEVLSPATEALDRGKKMRIYRREGVRHVWLLNPSLRTLEVYRLDAGRWTLVETFEGDELVRAEPFEAIELELGELWKGYGSDQAGVTGVTGTGGTGTSGSTRERRGATSRKKDAT